MLTFELEYLSQAIALALDNVRSGRGGPFGALVVSNGIVIGQGTNLVTATNDPTAHAEINAIREACGRLGTYRLDGAVLYTSCEPCPMCLGAIYWGRIAKVFYAATREDAARTGFDDALFYREFVCEPDRRSIPMSRIEAEDALAPFLEWERRENRIDY